MGIGATLFVALLAAIALAITIVVARAARRPSRFAIERSALIPGSPEAIIGHIENLRAMDAWNPFVTQNPGLQVTYSGARSGPGASSSWQDRRAGTGQLTVTSVDTPREVRMRLVMSRPVKAENDIVFRLEPDGDATRVSWRMSGKSGLSGKIMGMIFDSDRMIGRSFERGLEDLKTIMTTEGIRDDT